MSICKGDRVERAWARGEAEGVAPAAHGDRARPKIKGAGGQGDDAGLIRPRAWAEAA